MLLSIANKKEKKIEINVCIKRFTTKFDFPKMSLQWKYRHV